MFPFFYLVNKPFTDIFSHCQFNTVLFSAPSVFESVEGTLLRAGARFLRKHRFSCSSCFSVIVLPRGRYLKVGTIFKDSSSKDLFTWHSSCFSWNSTVFFLYPVQFFQLREPSPLISVNFRRSIVTKIFLRSLSLRYFPSLRARYIYKRCVFMYCPTYC